MARGVNRVILIGNLGADPEVRAMPSGETVANLRVATSEQWKDKQSGEAKERTEWHNVSMFGRLGEVAGEYLKKGSKAYFEGSLRTRKWQDKDGNDRYTTEVIATQMQMLDAPAQQQEERPQQSRSSRGQGRPQQRQQPQKDDSGDDFDDDIPFGRN